MPNRILLIRHGRTRFNAQGRFMGSTDVPLDAVGRREASALGRKLRSVKVDRVISSDLRRAKQSARAIFPRRPVEEFPLWREMNFGVFEGRSLEELS